jgi:predicted transposase YbfD/YdcC
LPFRNLPLFFYLPLCLLPAAPAESGFDHQFGPAVPECLAGTGDPLSPKAESKMHEIATHGLPRASRQWILYAVRLPTIAGGRIVPAAEAAAMQAQRRNRRLKVSRRGIPRLQKRHNWPGLKAVVMGESTRETAGKIVQETRFYITSLMLLAHLLGPIVRGHWAIENSLHWVMNMVFRDEEYPVRACQCDGAGGDRRG